MIGVDNAEMCVLPCGEDVQFNQARDVCEVNIKKHYELSVNGMLFQEMTRDEDGAGFLLDPFRFTPWSHHLLDGDREFFSSVLEKYLAYNQFWVNLTNTEDLGWSWGKVLIKIFPV